MPDLLAQASAELRGPVIMPSHPEYDRARRVWNAMFDGRRPLAVLRCADESDVIAAVRLLRDTEAPVAVRGGGHHIAGFGGCDGGFVIDLSLMRSATPSAERMRVQGGATLHDADVAGAAVGRHVPLGVVSETGVGGLTLSGGVGWLTRRHGYSCDNLVAARVVTADGELIRASETENADLLWALRGGGGNFGIVTEFELDSHPVGPVVVAEAYHVVEDGADVEAVLRFYRDWTSTLSRDLTVWILVGHVDSGYDLLEPEHRGRLVVALLGCYVGDSLEEGQRALAPLIREAHPTASRMSTMRMLDLQHLQDSSGAAASGMRSYMKGEMLAELTDSVISGVALYCEQMPTPQTMFEMGMLGGALGDRDELDAAVGMRSAQYLAGFELMSPTVTGEEGKIAWVREAWQTLLDGSAGGVYLNFSGDEGQRRVLDSLGAGEGPKRRKLAVMKQKYDPGNFFRLNHNILPTGSLTSDQESEIVAELERDHGSR